MKLFFSFLIMIFLSIFTVACSNESNLNEDFENDPYYGDSNDGGDPGVPGVGEQGYKN